MKRQSFRDGYSRGVTHTILILTLSEDFHAIVIKQALLTRGHRVITWLGDTYPERSAVSVFYEKGITSTCFHNKAGSFLGTEVDIVWNRRRTLARVPKVINKSDVEFVRRELEAAVSSHNQYFQSAFWINDYKAVTYCELKLLQLEAARKNRIQIPDSLISNNPEHIHEFLERFDSCIYKPFTGFVWRRGGKERRTFTSLVTKSDLPSDKILRATPGIFQKLIEKKYEVRAQFFGNYCAAIKINSLQLECGDLDWRINQDAINRCEQIQLPDDVYSSCRGIMRELGIICGAFDLIVDKDGQWIFLEVNQAGQFLFMETWCPDLHLVDAFCQFIEQKDAEFYYKPTGRPQRLSKIEKYCGL